MFLLMQKHPPNCIRLVMSYILFDGEMDIEADDRTEPDLKWCCCAPHSVSVPLHSSGVTPEGGA